MEAQMVNEKIKWAKALIYGLLAWIIGFIIFMIPAFVIGFKMGFELGPKSNDQAKLGEEIGKTISAFYERNALLKIGFTLITSIFIFWFAKLASGNTGSKKITNGMLVSIFPLLFSLLLITTTGFSYITVIELILFPAFAYLGGKFSKQEFNQAQDVHVQTSH